MTPSKAAAHEASMFFDIKDSALIQLTLDVKPFMPFYQDYDSPEMEGKPDNQNECDNYVEFD